MVAWALSMVLIDLPFSHWTHVTFKQASLLRQRLRQQRVNGQPAQAGSAGLSSWVDMDRVGPDLDRVGPDSDRVGQAPAATESA